MQNVLRTVGMKSLL